MTNPTSSFAQETAPHPVFDTISNPPGVEIYDPIEKVRFELHTPEAVSPRPASTDDFPFSMDSAVEFSTREIRLPKRMEIEVWQGKDTVGHFLPETGDLLAPRGNYYISLSTTPIKIYVGVESAISVECEEKYTIVDFGDERSVRVAARSMHRRPTDVITVTDNVEDAMRAVSLFGSALKTTSPERSFPTLRGHPPLLESGDEFSAPARIECPETGVEIEIPPDRASVYAVTPLAYYLGAKLVPGRTPRLVTDGFEYSLTHPAGFERAISETLQQAFFLDCLTRTEGYYNYDPPSRRQVEPLTNLDFAELYDASLAEQLQAYLSISFETLEPHMPQWHLTTDVVPTADNVEILPFVADDLSLVRCPPNPAKKLTRPQPPAIAEFCRSSVMGEEQSASDKLVVEPESVESVEHAWIGDGCPLGSNKLTIDSRRRRIEQESAGRSNIRIQVVCNDESMKAEGEVREMYGFRELVEYDVDISYNLTTNELRDLLASDIDFLHYIGHVDQRGIRCADGVLDTTTLEAVNVQAFLLNACRSYKQGEALVTKGSRAGIVTLSDVSNRPATKVGRTLARLLNAGFSLRPALSLAQKQTFIGHNYVILGDGGTTLCQSPSCIGSYLKISEGRNNRYTVEVHTSLVPRHSIGTVYKFYHENADTVHLCPGHIGTFEMTGDELDSYLETEYYPIEYDGDIYWSEDITASDLD